ncbi:Hypothetical protein I5071_3160 [Sandaracinus amylolyticus]|nr:Hypothetical protein I5071_3160 [Sandaracinus amylolyticus]
MAITLLLLLTSACGDDDAVGTPDAGGTDAGSGLDAATIDAGREDAGEDEELDSGAPDAGEGDAGDTDAGAIDAGASDAGASDAGTDAGSTPDSGMVRTPLLVQWCPISGSTPAGAYRGTLASSLNEVTTSCGGGSAPGRDAAVRIELAPGATLGATYRHAGDGILSLVDSCPAIPTCLEAGLSSSSGETLSWTNTGATSNPVYLILDSDALDGPQTFELDLVITAP